MWRRWNSSPTPASSASASCRRCSIRCPRSPRSSGSSVAEIWPSLEGQEPAALVHRVRRPRGGNIRGASLPFGEGVDQALWDLAAKQLNLPLWKLLGGTKPRVKAYASGLDYHLSDDDFCALFDHAASIGYTAFKIKVGHPDIERDLHRLDLLVKTVGKPEAIMIDANEGWSPQQIRPPLNIINKAGFDILWIEDPLPSL